MKHLILRSNGLAWFRNSCSVAVVAIAVFLLTGCPGLPIQPTPSNVYNKDYRIVFPKTAIAPMLDGLADTDPGWTSGFNYAMEDGGPKPAARFRGTYDDNYVYFYLETEDVSFNGKDVLVIAFNPDNAAGNYRRIHIFPCYLGGCPDNASGIDVTANTFSWTGNISGIGEVAWSIEENAASQGIQAMVATASAGAKVKWSIELKIPRGAPFNFVDTNFFGMFVDIVRTDPMAGITGEAVQYTWPPSLFIGSTDENDALANIHATVKPMFWGNATLNTSFGNGISISSADIGTNYPGDRTKISITGSNIFYGIARNFTQSGGTLSGPPVTATFKIANNGLPALGHWAPIPVGGNPTAPVNIFPTSSHQFNIGPWNLTPAQQADYLNNQAQCVQVELNSTDPSAIFINKYAMVNMSFVKTSSPFKERAWIGTRGFELPKDRKMQSFILREQVLNLDPDLKWQTEISNSRRLSNPNSYFVEIEPQKEGVIDISVLPPKINIPSEFVRMQPGTGGSAHPPIRLDVKPNEIITLIAEGTIAIGSEQVSASGVPSKMKDYLATATHDREVAIETIEVKSKGVNEVRRPLVEKESSDTASYDWEKIYRKIFDMIEGRDGFLAHSNRIGALVGSFDGFEKSSFVIGNAATIKVPDYAHTLSLAINDREKGYSGQRGEGYNIQVVKTPIDQWMLADNPRLARKVIGSDVFVNLGANLPTWFLRGERDTGRYLRIGDQVFRVYESVGSFGYYLKQISF